MSTEEWPQPRFRMWDTVQVVSTGQSYIVVGIGWNNIGKFYRYELRTANGWILHHTETDNLKLVERPFGTLCASQKEGEPT